MLNNLDFNYVSAKNFVCFGKDGIELYLTRYGRIVLIRGYNLDRHRTEGDDIDDDEKKVASNGTGKSTIPEIISYTLFGETIKNRQKIKHKDVINNKSKKGLRVETRWSDYRVVRTRKPDSLRMWESKGGDWSNLGDEDWEKEHEITVGGIPATQKLIIEKLGLNYETFVNVMVFTDNNAGSFLELDAAAKREIVENLLSLDKFREYYDVAKKERNRIKGEVKLEAEGYQYRLRAFEDAKNHISKLKEQERKWVLERKDELKRLERLVDDKMAELATSDMGAALATYHQAQDKIEQLNQQTTTLIDNDAKIKKILDKAREEYEKGKEELRAATLESTTYHHQIVAKSAEQTTNEKLVKALAALKEGTKCPVCHGLIQQQNFIDVLTITQEKLAIIGQEIADLSQHSNECELRQRQLSVRLHTIQEAIKTGEAKSSTISKQLVQIRNEISRLSKLPKPDSSAHEKLIEQQLNKLQEEVHAKRNEIEGPSPFVDVLTSAEKEAEIKGRECADKKKEVERLEEELPYYEFFVDAFSEDGIRKFVIAGILPALNAKITYWLQFLMDSKISLQFNNQLDEVIERNPSDGDPFVYHAMSGGERRMLNLAVSQAFAHIMMLNSGASPSCAFLDEVTTNIDQIGVQGVYNMIMELSREKQVFVTTHDHDLLEMLTGCDTIELQKKDGFTTLI